MSRYEVYHEDKVLAFGKDRACGEFLMIWTRAKDEVKRRLQDEFGPDPEDILVDKDQKFNKDFDHFERKLLIKEHGFVLEEMKEAAKTGLSINFDAKSKF